MTVVTFASASFDMAPLARKLEARCPQWTVRVWPEAGFEEAEVVVGWNVPPGFYPQFRRLRLIHAIAAGVDNLLKGQDTGAAAVCRVVDEHQARGMLEYVLWGVLYFHRGFDRAIAQQREETWRRPAFTAPSAWRVGIMGLGEMGSQVAAFLPALGYAVNGWSQSRREIAGVNCHAGKDELSAFLGATDILVCLLPLTDETHGLLNTELFAQLPENACVIHCGRGEHLVLNDLRAALNSGRLRGAIVDVFPREPLAPGHNAWAIPGLLVTPHMATMASQDTIIDQIVGNVTAVQAGGTPTRQVNVLKGY